MPTVLVTGAARGIGKAIVERLASTGWDVVAGVRSERDADAITKGARVLIHDDLLATGGTAQAKVDLVEQLGGEVVGLAFVIELAFLNGRDRLEGYDVFSLIQYE